MPDTPPATSSRTLFGLTYTKLDILRGRGQIDWRRALPICIGRGLRDRYRIFFTLAWGFGCGVAVSLSTRSWAYGMTSAFLASLCIMLFSVFPWRIRLHRSRTISFARVLLTNGLLACAMGAALWALSMLVPVTIFLRGSLGWMLTHPWVWLPWSFVFPVVGISLCFSEDGERLGRRVAGRSRWLERLAEEAHILALRAQINPHFFFNALNTIAALIPERPADAERAVELLAEALRPALHDDQSLLASIDSELRIARAYAELESLRWGDRVRFEFDIDSAGNDGNPPTLDAAVPALSLQPILENAVRHGASKTSDPYHIQLSVVRAGENAIRIESRNAPASEWSNLRPDELTELTPTRGHALFNIGLRLRALFGPAARLEIRTGDPLLGYVCLVVPAKPIDAMRNRDAIARAAKGS